MHHIPHSYLISRFMRLLFITSLFVSILGINSSIQAATTDGTIDPTFGADGRVTTDFFGYQDNLRSIVVHPDGSIIAVGTATRQAKTGFTGSFAKAHYDAQGVITARWSSGLPVSPKATLLQPDGRMLVVGSNNNYFNIARYMPNGNPDPTFSTDGSALITFGLLNEQCSATSLALQTDGKVFVAGSCTMFYSNNIDIALVRLTASGELDTSFSSDGRLTTDLGKSEMAHAVFVMPDGTIVVVGNTWTFSTQRSLVLVRYVTDGTRDITFGTNGFVTNSSGRATTAKLTPDGQIVIVGDNNSGDMFIARYSNDTPDYAFGTLGATVIDTGATESGKAVALLPGGQIIIAGDSTLNGITSGILVRLSPNGEADPTFGNGGVITNLPDSYTAISITPDGKLIAAGGDSDFALVRYDANGLPDLTFGGGMLQHDSTSTDEGQAIILQPDNRILVVGSGVMRYTSDGQIDSTFGTAGRVALAPGQRMNYGLALQPNGAILTAGSVWNGSDMDLAVARYTSAGVLDTTFGTAGVAVVDIGGIDTTWGVALQPDGNILVIGTTDIGSTQDLVLARFTHDGRIDTSFGQQGRVITNIGGTDTGRALALQPDGKILVVGSTTLTGDQDIALLRYTTDGTLDPSFANAGIATTDFASLIDAGIALAVQPDGMIVVAGTTRQPLLMSGAGVAVQTEHDEVALARYRPDGSPDTSFSGDGKVKTHILPDGNSGWVANDIDNVIGSVLVQNDGKILVGGHTNYKDNVTTTTFASFTLARYLDIGVLDSSFGHQGVVTEPDTGGFLGGGTLALQPNGQIVLAGTVNTDIAIVRYQNTVGTPKPWPSSAIHLYLPVITR